MTYDLAVWEGPLPSEDEATAVFEELMDRMESDADDLESSAKIRAYVDALLERWPDITEEGGDDSPWADGPLICNASGNAIYFSMVFSQADEGVAFAGKLAAEHGLVCYDPQFESLHQTDGR